MTRNVKERSKSIKWTDDDERYGKFEYPFDYCPVKNHCKKVDEVKNFA